jgi:hypothetical protein
MIHEGPHGIATEPLRIYNHKKKRRLLRTRVLQRTVLIGHYSLALFECIKKY